MSETIEIHFSNGTHGRITFPNEGGAKIAMLAIAQAKWEGHMYTPETPNGEKLYSYNPDHITWMREV